MTTCKRGRLPLPYLAMLLVAMGGLAPMRAAPSRESIASSQSTCNLQAVAQAKAEFERRTAQHRFDPATVSMNDVRTASLEYIAVAEECYRELYGPPNDVIDDGGLRLPGNAPEFFLSGTKWGAGSPFISSGADSNGPRIPAGTVTYSFMNGGVGGFDIEGGTPGTGVAITSLPTFSSCFMTEITGAFAAWSAIANIQFTEVPDGGQPFNAAGGTGDIRIVAHVFDGPSNVLAHAYFPPPNGTSAAGDVHFDVGENWSCTSGTGGIDLGVVAVHEIGHSIGLNHETRFAFPGRPAVMNPFYNPSVASAPLGDDVNGAENIYGSAVGNSPDAIVDFGNAFGVWILKYGAGWTQLSEFSPEQVVTGDLDGNGIDEIVGDFGDMYGVWIRMNNASWVQLLTLNPSNMAVGDLDNSGRDDIVLDVPGFGVWRWMNNGSWSQLQALDSTVFAIGNLDNAAGDDVVLTFAGFGVWRWMNNASWVQVHERDATRIVTGDLDETLSSADNADDLVLSIPGVGTLAFLNLVGPLQLHSLPATRMATGDINGDGRDELVADLGPSDGVWLLRVGAAPTPLQPFQSEDVTLGDLDGNGQAEILVDFGETLGFWIFVNNSSWIQGHALSPEGFAVGDLD